MIRSDLNSALEYFGVRVTLILGGSIFLLITAAFIFFVGPYIAVVLGALVGLAGVLAIIFALILLTAKGVVAKIKQETN